jgi:hypothetical protein
LELPQETAENILFKLQQKAYDKFLDDWTLYDSLVEDDNRIEREKILKEQSKYFLLLYGQLPEVHQKDIKFWVSMDEYFAELWKLNTFDYKFEENKTE